jgi:hypothetical protein
MIRFLPVVANPPACSIKKAMGAISKKTPRTKERKKRVSSCNEYHNCFQDSVIDFKMSIVL